MARVDLSGIKTEIQSVLDGANTTTGAPIDLSDNLTNRVRQVLQLNMERIPIQPSFFPCVTMYFDTKTVTLKDISRDMLNSRRQADIAVKIVGVVWIDNMNTANYQYKDLSDNEVEQLMENVEQVLRKDPTLNNKVLWSKTTDVSYHTYPVSEDAHMRAGVMTFVLSVLY